MQGFLFYFTAKFEYMLKKLLLGLVFLALIALAAGYWFVKRPVTGFDKDVQTIYIRTGQANKNSVMQTLKDSAVVVHPVSFEKIAGRMDIWTKIRPGKYDFKKGASALDIARMLRNGQQSTVNLVINKIRTKEQLARLVGRRFETDSLKMIHFLNDTANLSAYQVDTTTLLSIIFPNTYTYFWAATPKEIMDKLYREHTKFWNEERVKQSSEKGLTPTQVYTLASIIDEETNYDPEKELMASVYLNRIKKGIPLGADPTIKYALRDFTLKRILNVHTRKPSPYNTYLNKGLPPGPICTPNLASIEAVLNAPATNYLFFVANSDLSKRNHIFTENYSDHLKYAREYQKELTAWQKRKQAEALNSGQ